MKGLRAQLYSGDVNLDGASSNVQHYTTQECEDYIHQYSTVMAKSPKTTILQKKRRSMI